MSVIFDVAEHLKVRKNAEDGITGASEAADIMAGQIAALAALMTMGEGRIWEFKMTADGKEYGLSKSETISEFREILSALANAGEVDLVIRYDYCWRAGWQMYELVGPFPLMDFMNDPDDSDTSGVFYSAWNKADSDEGSGNLVAYGEHNGKTYSGVVPFERVSDIPEGLWDEQNTPIIIDPLDPINAAEYPDLVKVCQELAKMGRDPNLDYDNGLTFYLNGVTLASAEERARYAVLVDQLARLVPVDIGVCFEGDFADTSGEDARLMTIDHDGQDLVIKVAEIL